MESCATCGAPIDPATANYSDAGDLVCSSCKSADDIDARGQRAVASFVATAGLALALGFVSIFFNVLLLPSGFAVTLASTVLWSLHQNTQYHERMGGRRPAVYAMCIAAILLGLVQPTWFFFLFFVWGS